MAYKVQIGAMTAAGAISTSTGAITSAGGLDAGDGNITNVGDIAVDSISADGNDMEINMTDNRSTAFVIKESSNVYVRANTANSGGEKVEFKKGGLKKSLEVPEDYTFKKAELERLKSHDIGKRFQFKGKKFTMDDKLKKQITLALTLMSSKK